jgi:hypothetical protein
MMTLGLTLESVGVSCWATWNAPLNLEGSCGFDLAALVLRLRTALCQSRKARNFSARVSFCLLLSLVSLVVFLREREQPFFGARVGLFRKIAAALSLLLQQRSHGLFKGIQ